MFGLGMPELIFIFGLALLIFGPRKLPDIGRTLGQAMGQFRKASDEFKQTWESEVNLEKMQTSSPSKVTTEIKDSSDSSVDSTEPKPSEDFNFIPQLKLDENINLETVPRSNQSVVA